MEILRTADAERVDLIVIATHGLTGWRRLAFGSVTDKIVRTADCPVRVRVSLEFSVAKNRARPRFQAVVDCSSRAT
jgi:Universal stress protein family